MMTRRDLLKSGGALIVSFAVRQSGSAQGRSPELDSFIAVRADGSVLLSTSHVDVGTGISTVFR